MSTLHPDMQCLQFLRVAPEFFCFARVWLDGNGVDAVVWWRSADGCRKSVIRTGETYTEKVPQAIGDKPVSENELASVLGEFVSLGLCRLESQHERIAMSHFDDWFGIKLCATSDAHWLKIAGGKHLDPDAVSLLDHVFARCPELAPQAE